MQTAPAAVTPLDRRVAAVRAFNRFYTRRIGVVREGYLQSRFSLTEARVLFELAQTEGLTAAQIGSALDLDAGYLSRMLRRFEQEGLLARGPSAVDRRQHILTLTESGLTAFLPLDERSRLETSAMLSALPEPAQEAVVSGLRSIARMLSDQPATDWFSRPPAPGDIGWVIERHGALYAEEYGFDHRFEALVAQVAGAFLSGNDPERERAWIAERDGVRVGSVFLVRKTDEIGKLRLLLVEPWARGLGVGKRLVEECIAFARQAGYRRVTLWTNDILVAARGIYRAAGFHLVASEPHSDFGPPMVGEEWELTL
jgi:DNA-binding MarR family transcriptional regulator/N-acetylglutamate synthase-like GNAT family acetyltransferase